jgi:hypothetical protein
MNRLSLFQVYVLCIWYVTENSSLCTTYKSSVSPDFSNLTELNSKSKSHCDWRSVSQSWCRDPCGADDQIFIIVLTVTVLLLWGALSDERTGLYLSESLSAVVSDLS